MNTTTFVIIPRYNTIQYNKQFILCRISDKIVTQRRITSLKSSNFSIYNMYAFVNKYVFNLFLKTAREGTVFYGDRQGIIQHGCCLLK